MSIPMVAARCFYCDLIVPDKAAYLECGTGCVKCAECVAYDRERGPQHHQD